MGEKGFEVGERHGKPVVEIGGGEDTGIEVAGVHKTEVFHAGIEVGIGHGARVLKFAQDGVVEAIKIAIGDDGFECSLASIRD